MEAILIPIGFPSPPHCNQAPFISGRREYAVDNGYV